MAAPGISIALYSPRIPQNVGAVGRLCAATRAPLHIVRPVPFPLDDKSLRRTGMDYWDYVGLTVHSDFASLAAAAPAGRVWLFTTRATVPHTEARFAAGDWLLFGNESHGVPDDVHDTIGAERCLRIPILDERARSLNLASAVAIGLYEALRQARAW